MRNVSLILCLLFFVVVKAEYKLSGFTISKNYGEQEKTFKFEPDVRIEINAPSIVDFDPNKPTAIMLYALPNGNTIEWTKGKTVVDSVYWRYGIQHIAAQTRYIRSLKPNYNFVVVYLEAKQRAWKTWRKNTHNSDSLLLKIVDDVREIFKEVNPYIMFSGHSGGGNFIFGFIENVDEIPSWVERISFLDSNYNWDERAHGKKLLEWLKKNKRNKLSIICYDDRNALYNGKPIVSDTGGTGTRSNMMIKFLRENTNWKWIVEDDSIMTNTRSRNNQVECLWVKNPERKIYHTVLVRKNGLIQGGLFGTKHENEGYVFWNDPVYDNYITAE